METQVQIYLDALFAVHNKWISIDQHCKDVMMDYPAFFERAIRSELEKGILWKAAEMDKEIERTEKAPYEKISEKTKSVARSILERTYTQGGEYAVSKSQLAVSMRAGWARLTEAIAYIAKENLAHLEQRGWRDPIVFKLTNEGRKLLGVN